MAPLPRGIGPTPSRAEGSSCASRLMSRLMSDVKDDRNCIDEFAKGIPEVVGDWRGKVGWPGGISPPGPTKWSVTVTRHSARATLAVISGLRAQAQCTK